MADRLKALGFTQSLVNIGEYRGAGGPWTLGLADPRHGMVDTHTFENAAVATSSPMATPIGANGHIFLPAGHDSVVCRPWSTVSAKADTATLADALSTGMVWADMTLIEKIRQSPGVRRVTLVIEHGDLINLQDVESTAVSCAALELTSGAFRPTRCRCEPMGWRFRFTVPPR